MSKKSLRQKFPKSYFQTKALDESGAALVIALMFLVILTLLGSAAIRTSLIEMEITGNQKQNKMAFYEADGGTEVGIELIEEAISERGYSVSQVGSITIVEPNFYLNADIDTGCPEGSCKPRSSYRDAFYNDVLGMECRITLKS